MSFPDSRHDSHRDDARQAADSLEAEAAAAFDLGARERESGNVDAARSAFLRAAAGGHSDIAPKALANLAVLEASVGRTGPARAAFEQAIASGHREHAPQSLFNFAVFQQRNGESGHARELYERAVANGHPEHGRKALFNLANLTVDEGRLDEACAIFLRAMAPPYVGDTACRAHRRLVEVAPGRRTQAREVYLRAIAGNHEATARQARELLYDLDPTYNLPGETIRVGSAEVALADVEDAEWSTGRRPGYSSGYLDVFTCDGREFSVFVDLRDPYDRRLLDALRGLLGPDRL